MLAVSNNDILIGEVSASPSRRIPTELADVDRIAEYILYSTVLERIATVSADTHCV